MTDFDEQARAAAERVRRDAQAMAASNDPRATIDRSHDAGTRGHRNRWLLVAASVVVLAAGVAGLAAITDDRSNERTDEPTVTVNPPDGIVATEPPVIATAVPDTTAATTTADTQPDVQTITQPVIDPQRCTPVSATDPRRSGLPRDPGGSLPLTLFGRPSELPIPIQVIADPVDGQAKPFAMVLRSFDSERPVTESESVTINGVEVGLSVHPNGSAQATWNLPDGSQGHLRSRGLDRDQLIAIISTLSPRPADAAIPGFDYGTGGPPTLELVVDQMNSPRPDGRSAGSWCQMTPNLGYQVSAHRGDALYTYGAIIDRPPPLDVAVVGDTVIQVCCVADPNAPTAADVVQADDDLWQQLLLAEVPIGTGAPIPVGDDLTATVDLLSFDPSTPVSSLTLRRKVQDGVAFLEVDETNVVLSPLSEYSKIEVNGRIRSRATAHAGGVMGVRLGDASSTEPFTVVISTTDGDDITTQTTGQILLQPTP